VDTVCFSSNEKLWTSVASLVLSVLCFYSFSVYFRFTRFECTLFSLVLSVVKGSLVQRDEFEGSPSKNMFNFMMKANTGGEVHSKRLKYILGVEKEPQVVKAELGVGWIISTRFECSFSESSNVYALPPLPTSTIFEENSLPETERQQLWNHV
jgi:hypothetical protein